MLKRRQLLICGPAAVLRPASAQGPEESGQKAILAIERLLSSATDRSDLLEAKLLVDQLIDPSADIGYVRQEIGRMTSHLVLNLPSHASNLEKLQTLRAFLYEPGWWNRRRPVQYDFDYPEGDHMPTKLLERLLRTRRGNCHSLAFLFLILGQRLGLDVGAALAPGHIFVIYRGDDTKLIKLETSSNGMPRATESYRRDAQIPDEGITSGSYLRKLGNREAIEGLALLVVEDMQNRTRFLESIRLSLLVWKYAPRNLNAMIFIGNGFQSLLLSYVKRHQAGEAISAEDRAQAFAYRRAADHWFDKAELLGARQKRGAAVDRYKRIHDETRTTKGGFR